MTDKRVQNPTIQYLNRMKTITKKQHDFQFKFVMVGDSAVGKSSLLLRFADNQFNENYMITIGVDFRFKSVTVDDKIVKLQIWDTAGQERFRTIVNTYYKKAHAVYLIFDLTNRDSFNSIKNYWINESQSYTDQSVMTVLVGNKCDCPNRAVSEQDIASFVEAKKLQYFETSAKNSTNVNEMFLNIAYLLASKKGNKTNPSAGQDAGRKLEEVGQDNKRGYTNCTC